MIAALGRSFGEGVEEVGRAGGFVATSAGASRDIRTWLPRLTQHARILGVDSLPIALFIALFTGIVLALLASYSITGAVPGLAGLLMNDPRLYRNADSLVTDLRTLIADLKANPKKYVNVRIF